MPEPVADRPKRRGVYLLPNLMTTGCLFSGFYAVVAAIDSNFERAAISVFIAMLFDGLDGRIARWTGTESNFGKEYDSLADMVAFGVSPAIVTYQWGVVKIAEYGDAWRRFAWVVAFFYAVAAALRLARFNARSATTDKRYFEGLPSPSAAAVVAAFVWFFSQWREPGLTGLIVAITVTGLAGALMVSSFSYASLKQVDIDKRVKVAYFFVVVAFLFGIAFDPPTMLFALFATYALSAPAMWLWRKLTRPRRSS